MGAVPKLLDFDERNEAPTLVLVDLHDDRLPGAKPNPERKDFAEALEKCRTALSYARRNGLPVAFVRYTLPPPSFMANHACPSWIRDIRPQRSDMIFERAMPSCFASTEFAQMARRSRELVLAGLYGETSCLSTLVEGYGRSHHFTYLADASISRGRANIEADEMHRGVVEIASFYCEITSTEAWIDRMSRKIGAVG
ncbi:MAG TPA: isochorismatase family protein [Rhizomicrobium sp.]|nr:isochorismatase family protein [Rhizomicrobium sp.]